MAWLAAAMIGSSLLSGIGQAVGGNAAAKASEKASRLANTQAQQAQRRAEQFTQPWRMAGSNALSAQQALLGIGNGTGGTNAAGQTVGSEDWGAYLRANPDVAASFQSAAQQPHMKNMGINTPEDYARYHYETFGRTEGRQLPTVAGPTGADGQPLTQGQITDQAYNAFLDSGHNRAMTEFTNNDLEQIKAGYGAGGASISGSAVGAMGDRLARNRYNAFTGYNNDLTGMSNTGANVAANTGAQGMQTAQTINQNNMGAAGARASSYANTANAFSGVLQGVTDVAAYGSGQGWFGKKQVNTQTPAGTYNGITPYRGVSPGYTTPRF
jgi:hypothetical protein